MGLELGLELGLERDWSWDWSRIGTEMGAGIGAGIRILTLQSRSHGPGEAEVGVDAGAHSRGVVGAAALMGPQRAAGLEGRKSGICSKGSLCHGCVGSFPPWNVSGGAGNRESWNSGMGWDGAGRSHSSSGHGMGNIP